MSVKVYAAICNVTAEMAKIGIAKDRKNQQQGYSFRGIDDVYGALSPILAKNHLCILPRLTEHSVVERQTAKGGTIFYTTVRVEFDLVSAEDGSKHTVTMVGEAMDSADKSSNKAQSAAYKYMAMQTFCIPTEGQDNDADAHTHEVMPQVTGMTETVRADFLATIDSASTLEGLKSAYMKAKKAAEEARDHEAFKEFTAATNKRKAKLETELAGAYGEQA